MSELTVFPTIINFVLLSARERERDEERETEEQKRESVGLTTAVAALIRP